MVVGCQYGIICEKKGPSKVHSSYSKVALLFKCFHVLMFSCFHVFMFSCSHVFMFSCFHVLMFSCFHVFMFSCFLAFVALYHTSTYILTYCWYVTRLADSRPFHGHVHVYGSVSCISTRYCEHLLISFSTRLTPC